ncbi:MAG: hypothetical protein ACWA5P_06330 [bacterium]
MNKNQVQYLLFLFVISNQIHSQSSQWKEFKDVFSLNFKTVNDDIGNNLNISTGNVSFYTGEISNEIRIGINYVNFNLNFHDPIEGGGLNTFGNNHLLNVVFGYNRAVGKNWSIDLDFMPSLASNLGNEISSNDLIFPFSVKVSKKWINSSGESNLCFGLAYNTTFGKIRLYPVVSYQKQFENHLGFVIGFPESSISYLLNDRTHFSLKGGYYGYSFNNSFNSTSVSGLNQIFEGNTEYSDLRLALNINQRITNAINFNIGYEYIPNSQLDITNNLPVNFSTDFNNRGFIKMGLTINSN